MSSSTVVTKGYDPLYEAASHLLRVRTPRPGNNAKEARENLIRWSSEREGLLRGLSLLATKERVDAHVHAPVDAWIEGVDVFDVRPWWEGIEKRWDAEEWKDVSDDVFAEQLRENWISEIVMPNRLAEKHESHRRKLVLEGKIEVSGDDLEWLQEERDRAVLHVTPYDKLLSKLNG